MIAPLVAVDRQSSVPLHRQINQSIRALILERKLHPGQQLPSSRALAFELSVSRLPVLEAYGQLLAEAYIEARSGSGTFVANVVPDDLLQAPTVALHREPREPQAAPVQRPWLGGSGAFSVGQLTYDHFPVRIWSDLLARRARRMRVSDMNYSDPMGDAEFRDAIAAYLRTARSVHCEASQILVVHGSQNGLQLCIQALLDRERAVWIEEPGYEFLQDALRLAGIRMIPVPVDREGLDVAAGIRLAGEACAAFVTPSHQYPLGCTMSAARRMQLIEWARASGSWIVEDDYDSDYRYESPPVVSLQGLDRGMRTLYIGTFSKTLFPALRLGYVVVPPELLSRFVTARRANDICPSPLVQSALADFINEGHFARHIRKTRKLYATRRATLVEALREEFDSKIEILGAEAGMHLVVAFPGGVADQDIARRAAAAGLQVWPLSTAYLGEPARHGFVLGFGGTRAEEMRPAVQRLYRLVHPQSGHARRSRTGH